MKNATLLVLLFIFSNGAQSQILERETFHQEASLPTSNDAVRPCITLQEYEALNLECSQNRKSLQLETNYHRDINTPTLAWPLRAASGFTDCDFYFIGAYVDQNTATNSIIDYNCENNTYDGHHGTDIAIWPYGFYKMDNSQVEVVASAAGTIIQKADGNFDRNCSANNLTANSIVLQHADGSCTLYWHMKKNSVTSKVVGQTVAAGEYLGVVGSSGSASGPHLHFEVWSGTTNTTYQDPYSGGCNTLNANSLWMSQKPHTNPAILKVSTNATDLIMPGCPNTETPNESNSFAIPFQGAGLPAGYAKFYMFFRELTAGTMVDLKIMNPNGTTFNSWTYSVTAFNKIGYWGWSKVLPTTAGVYTFQATYNGVTCAQSFTIVNPLGIVSNVTTALEIYPNPASTVVNLVGSLPETGNYIYTVSSVSGQVVKTESFDSQTNTIAKIISIEELPTGIYFLTLTGANSKTVKKIIRQ